jgi:hypothetical protein
VDIPRERTNARTDILANCIPIYSIPDKYIKTSYTSKKNSKKRAT